MPDQPISDPDGDDEATRAVARLPGLDIEIEHHRSAEAERISIHVQAMPSFEAFSRSLGAGNPLDFWTTAVRIAWLPWLACFTPYLAPWLDATRALMPPQHVSDAPPTLPEG